MIIDDLIIENRIDFVKNRFLSTIERLLPLMEMPDYIKTEISNQSGTSYSEKFFNWVMSHDPTKNKIYTQWLLRCIFKYKMPLEDVTYANETLSKFHDMKRTNLLRTDSTDINKFTTISDLNAAIRPQEPKVIASLKDEPTALNQSMIIYDGPELLVISPKTQFAACYFGQPTEWCTAYGNHLKLGLTVQGRYPTRGNLFDYYNKKGDLYIIINKKDPSDRWQFYFYTYQFMNKDDKPIDPKTLIKKYPILGEIFNPIFTVRENPYSIQYMKNPNIEVQIAAVRDIGYSIQYIKNPSEEVQLAAVKQNPHSIQYIKNPSEEVQLAAVRDIGYSIQYIKNPSEEVKLAAVQQNPYSFQYIKNPSEELQLAAIQQNSYSIEYIKNPNERIQMAAVQKNGNVIQYIKNPSERVQMAAVQKIANSIRYIKNPSEKVQMAAVQKSTKSIRYIKNPSERVQMAAAANKH